MALEYVRISSQGSTGSPEAVDGDQALERALPLGGLRIIGGTKFARPSLCPC